VKYVNPVTKLCIIRVSREDHQKVWAAITMVRCIGKIPVSFNLLDMSGEWLTLWIMTPNSVVVLGFLTLAFQCNIPAIYSFHL
jgi:ribonuclease P/MRP protein subunit POP5